MHRLVLSIAAATLFVSNSTFAAPIHVGTFDLKDAFSTHGVWLNKSVQVGGASAKTFDMVSGTFVVNNLGGGSFDADMTGEVFASEIGGGFTFNVDFDYLCTGLTQCGGLVSPFVSPQPTGNVPGSLVDQELWDFYEMKPAQLIGTGSLSGVTVNISKKPANGEKPFRFGIGADWNNPFTLGGSGWWNIDSVSSTNPNVRWRATHGDFNAAVPEPGILSMLGLSLLAVGLTRRRR